MNNKVIILIFSIIMFVAYADLVDCFKYFEKIMSEMILLDSEIKTEIDMGAKKSLKTQK